MNEQPPLGVVGGSGFYEFLDGSADHVVETPYGSPSAPVTIGTVEGRSVAFLPRHGRDHEYPPHRVNYRANVWALHAVGVREVISPCAAGSLSAGIHPGDFVVLDQLVDRTWGRPDTFCDGPELHHVGFADPYCARLGGVLQQAGSANGITVHRRGTVVVINGPRFSTRAESSWYRANGWEIVNMTQYPECVLARELGMCFAGLALVTDYDTGTNDADVPAVDMNSVLAVLEDNVARLRTLLVSAIAATGETPRSECNCDAGRAPHLA